MLHVATSVEEADIATSRGQWAEAAAAVERAIAVVTACDQPDKGTIVVTNYLKQRSDLLAQQSIECQQLVGELHAALTDGRWSKVLSTADAILALAPRHTAAQ